MTREERTARRELAALASEERGRLLLQLALRSIQESGRGLTIGCWVKPGGGVSGCVFQHAYWQGLAEGAFDETGRASQEIKEMVPAEDFHLVMEAIRALDALGKRRFVHRHGLRRALDEDAWRDTVERLLVDALAAPPSTPTPAPVSSSA